MTTSRRLLFIACTALVLAACTPRPNLTTAQVKGVAGLSMDQVEAKLGGPYVVTNAGDSVWWDYNNIVTPDGDNNGTCQVVFKKGVVDKVKC